MHELPSPRLLADLEWFEKYYFNYNDDPRRYNQFLDLLESFTLPQSIPKDPCPVCEVGIPEE